MFSTIFDKIACGIETFSSGNISSSTQLTGGDSSFSATGALVGGLIAGPIGSVLAGVTTNPYRLETKTTDKRKLFLC